MNKKAAMEMSVGTIVTIVLLMTVLILGLTLTRGIFNTSKGVIEMTDAQLKDEIKGLFSDSDSKVIVLPTDKRLEVKQGKEEAIGVGITNRLSGTEASSAIFSYELYPFESDLEECGISEEELMSWITRETMENIQIPPGGTYSGSIVFTAPDNAPLCRFGFHINVFVDDGSGEEPYVSPMVFDVKVK